MPDYGRLQGLGQRRYVINSRQILESLAKGAWKRLAFPPSGDGSLKKTGRKKVWRPDMIRCVERDMERHAPDVHLGP